MRNYNDDACLAREAFEKTVLPEVSGSLGLEHFECLEGTALDLFGGIDWSGMSPEGDTIGLAVRVQVNSYSFETFTVRYWRQSGTATEYEKRTRENRHPGALWPFYTVQAYVSPSGEFLSAGIVETERLMSLVKRELAKDFSAIVRKVHVGKYQTETMLTISWSDLINRDIPVTVVTRST